MAQHLSLKTKYKSDTFDIFIGQKLRELRESLEESQNTFSLRINVTFQQIQKYERGINRLSHRHIYDLSQQCNIPMTYFTDGYIPDQPEEELIAQNLTAGLSRSSLRVARLFNLIKDPKKEKAVMNLLTAVLEDDGSGDGK